MGYYLSKTWLLIRALTSRTVNETGQFGDGREDAVLKYVLENAEKNPESVLEAIDKYAHRCFLMNIGDVKGPILGRALDSAKPRAVLELGAYVGYSATLISSKLEAGSKLMSLEMSPENASIAKQVLEHAGVSDKVEVVTGILSNKLEEARKFLEAQGREQFDFVFIDHDKEVYLSDFLILKENGLIGRGSVVFADNLGIPGVPKYWDFMQNHKDEYDTVVTKTSLEYASWLPDTVLVTTCK